MSEFEPPQPLPAEYERFTRFTQWEATNPMSPKRGTDLDGEFDQIALAIREMQFRARMIQSDDGSLRNRIIGIENLDESILLGYEPPAPWQAETEYTKRSSVFYDYVLYLSNEEHVSGTNFENDLAAGKWDLAYDFRTVVEEALAARDQAEGFAEDSRTARDQSRAARDTSVEARDRTQELRDEVRQWLDLLTDRTPTLFVAVGGDDTFAGTNPKQPLASVKRALEIAANDYAGGVVSVFVRSGFYAEENPMYVPPFCAVLGDSLRTTKVSALNKGEDMFQFDNGSYASEMMWTGLELDDLENPTKGFGAVFAPGAYITTSPYIQNCSTITNRPPEELYAPLDKENGNPALGLGGGGMLCDPTVLDPYSPLRSMIVDAYTQVNMNGLGVWARKGGFVQMVSFFTNFCRRGCWATDGGHIVLLNSNTTFGDYGLVADGSRNVVVMDLSDATPLLQSPNAAALIRTNKAFAIEEMWARMVANGDVPGWSTDAQAFTRKDAGILIDALARDVEFGQTASTERFVQNEFDWNGQRYIRSEYIPACLNSWTYLRSILRDVIVNAPVATNQAIESQVFDTGNPGQAGTRADLANLIDEMADQYQNPVTETFGSLIVTTSHDFSYAGAGTNFMALPASQGGRGSSNIEDAVVQTNGGRVYYTAGDETGDFYIGDGLVIRQASGTLEGRTFNQALFAQMTPFILALESS
jgi:hypothetical protein